MGKVITNPKNYTGKELEQIFFRPLVSGPDALDLGIRLMYNMPVPTTLNFWKRAEDVLKKYAKGWEGGGIADKYQKTIALSKVKAEMGYAAEEYFGMIYEQITNDPKVNLDDLSGTQLEAAETALFRASIAESIRATMWLGDTTRESGFNTFDGFFKRLYADIGSTENDIQRIGTDLDMTQADAAEDAFAAMLREAPEALRAMKSQGRLVFLVTRDVYENYEDTLLSSPNLESVRTEKINGNTVMKFRGIPVKDIGIDAYDLKTTYQLPESCAILTDSRNLALAVNTNDYPGAEVRMWYNPDEMENRQRAIFMAGCDYLLPELIAVAHSAKPTQTDDDSE
mgnify:CR=1 FL=1